MKSPRWQASSAVARVLWLVLLATCAATAAGQTPVLRTDWSPVRIGAGGWVTGFVTHPLDARVRFVRTDVGNAYRWDEAAGEWIPMLVSAPGLGLPASLVPRPGDMGVESIAVDPADTHTVYLTTRIVGSEDDRSAQIHGMLLRSVDGGRTFTRLGLNLPVAPNADWRAYSERLCIDPAQPQVMFYATREQGLWRSADRGQTWQPVLGNGAPAGDSRLLGLAMPVSGARVDRGGLTVSARMYAVGLLGTVWQSLDGGVHWTDISAGTALQGWTGRPTADAHGNTYVVQIGSRRIWKAGGPIGPGLGTWAVMEADTPWFQTICGIGVDPRDPARMYVIGEGGALSRSNNGGATWTPMTPNLAYAAPWAWLPQLESWRSNSGITIDREGTLWIAQGNEGVLRATATDTETEQNPIRWTIDSRGIEEFVTHDAASLPGGRWIFAVEDASALVTSDPTRFVARQATLQTQQISNSTGLGMCPNNPDYVAVVTSDVNGTGTSENYSGFTRDGGQTWTRFATVPTHPGTGLPLNSAGSIAISLSNGNPAQENLVWLPTGGFAPFYSRDGGRTWSESTGMPGWNAYWIFSLKQRALVADPFVRGRFYAVGTWAGGLYRSDDGGATWQEMPNAGLPRGTHHGNLVADPFKPDHLWFASGWEGAWEHGLWHSTDAGQTFRRLPGVRDVITLAVGPMRGRAGSGTIMYIYGQLEGDDAWGVFASGDGGARWYRLSTYPMGIYDHPTCITASCERPGEVVIGFNGNSFVRGVVWVSDTWLLGTRPDPNGDGRLDVEDVYAQNQHPLDINGDGVVNAGDLNDLVRLCREHEIRDMTVHQR